MPEPPRLPRSIYRNLRVTVAVVRGVVFGRQLVHRDLPRFRGLVPKTGLDGASLDL